MLRIDSAAKSIYNSSTYRIYTPDGTMFINMIEDTNRQVIAIDIQVGKAGGSLRAWAHCFGRLLTMALEHGASIEEIAAELSSQTSDRSKRYANGIQVRSGPEGVYTAIMMHKHSRFDEQSREMNLEEPRNTGRINNRRRSG